MSTGAATAIDAALLRRMPLPAPHGEGGKEARGRVLVVGGSREVPGAALLAGTAVLRAGAGKLQLATARSVAPYLGVALPEAMVVGLAESDGEGLEPAGSDRVVALAARCRALLVGPGLVEDDGTAELTRSVLERTEGVPIVLDAAAMMRLGELGTACARHEGRVVVTPHAGEMAGILGQDREAIARDPEGTAREVAGRFGIVVVLKGACSVIATPGGVMHSCEHGNVGLATSGSGDVLAGLIAGFLGRGAEPAQAAAWAVFVHGEAGNRLARRHGPVGYLAREIAHEVPGILAGLGSDDASQPPGLPSGAPTATWAGDAGSPARAGTAPC